jgi:hypothetical protein
MVSPSQRLSFFRTNSRTSVLGKLPPASRRLPSELKLCLSSLSVPSVSFRMLLARLTRSLETGPPLLPSSLELSTRRELRPLLPVSLTSFLCPHIFRLLGSGSGGAGLLEIIEICIPSPKLTSLRPNLGCNPMDLRRGSQRAVEKILEVLEANKKLITTSAEIAQVHIPSFGFPRLPFAC